MSETKPAEGRMTDVQSKEWTGAVYRASLRYRPGRFTEVLVSAEALIAADAELTALRERVAAAEQRLREEIFRAKSIHDERNKERTRTEAAWRERDDARAQVGVLAGALDDICKKAVMITRRPSPDSTATAEIACCVPFAALQAARSALTTSAAEAGERWRLSESALAMLAPIRHNLLIRTVADTVREWLIEHDAELAALDAAKGAGE